MAKPTNTEMIFNLVKEVAILNERLNATREEVKELKRALEEESKRRWALLPPIVGAIVTVLLSGALAWFLSRNAAGN